MKTPAPSTYASVAVKKEIRAEIIRLCLEIKKHKDLASVFFTAKIPSKQARKYIQLSDGSYITRRLHKNYKKSDRPPHKDNRY